MESLVDNRMILAREEPRLTEQQFGNFQRQSTTENMMVERSKFGKFYYRFPNGESGLDVYNRVTLFIGTLFREWEKAINHDVNIIIITHGLTLRLFLMRWYHYTVEEFEQSSNPHNAQIVIMTRQSTMRANLDPDTDEKTLEEQEFFSCDEHATTYMKLRSTNEPRGDDVQWLLKESRAQQAEIPAKYAKFLCAN